MKKFCLLVALCVLTSLLAAQTYDQARIQLQFLNHYGEAAKRGYTGQSHVGSEFMYEDWRPMEIQFKDTTLRFDAVKLNLFYTSLEVMYEGEEKVIGNIHFRDVAYNEGGQKRMLMPANRFRHEQKPLEGFAEILGDGEERVLVQHHIHVKAPNANAHIVGGHTVNRYLKVESLYIFDGKNLTMIKGKKELKNYYRKKGKALDQYLKTQKPDLKDPQQLLAIVEAMK